MSMFPPAVLAAYLAAVVLVVLSPGPDNLMAIGRGLSQGPMAAALSAIGAGVGIMVHSLAATLGLSLLLQASPGAFWVVKLVGAAYLLWLGLKALLARDLVTFEPARQKPLGQVFVIGMLSNILNPKPGLFVLAFIPQFVSAARGPVAAQMLFYGAIFAVVTAVTFSVLGASAARLSRWMAARPRAGTALNVAAGLAFIGSAVSILLLKARA